MAQPEGHPLILGEEEAHQAEERYQALLAEVNQARENARQMEQELAVLREQTATAQLEVTGEAVLKLKI